MKPRSPVRSHPSGESTARRLGIVGVPCYRPDLEADLTLDARAPDPTRHDPDDTTGRMPPEESADGPTSGVCAAAGHGQRRLGTVNGVIRYRRQILSKVARVLNAGLGAQRAGRARRIMPRIDDIEYAVPEPNRRTVTSRDSCHSSARCGILEAGAEQRSRPWRRLEGSLSPHVVIEGSHETTKYRRGERRIGLKLTVCVTLA